jgi:hypothetical protein
MRQAIDQGADVFHAPSRRLRSKLYRSRETTVFDALPPSGLADGNWAARRKDGGKADKASFRKFVHFKLLQSKLTWSNPETISALQIAGRV